MNLKATVRTKVGSSAARQARREGLIPVTMYGRKHDAISLLINRREFEQIIRKEGLNAVFNVEYEDKVQQVLVKDFQPAALKDIIYNVDLEAVSADQKLEIEVPLYIINEETVKVGIVELIEQTIVVETTPANIPNSFEIDVTGLEIGDVKTVADLEVPAEVTVLMDPEQTIITVSAPDDMPEDVDPDAEVAEPEVIGEDAEEE